jgi:hypothetical protein
MSPIRSYSPDLSDSKHNLKYPSELRATKDNNRLLLTLDYHTTTTVTSDPLVSLAAAVAIRYQHSIATLLTSQRIDIA